VFELFQTLQTLLEILKNHDFLCENEFFYDANQTNLNAGVTFAHESCKKLIKLIDPKNIAFNKLQKHVALENFLRLQYLVWQLLDEFFQ